MSTKSQAVRSLKLTMLGALAVASVGLARPVRASDVTQDRIPASYAALMKMKPLEVMHMMGDGKSAVVTREQFMQFHAALFDKMDRNHDGQLSEEEFVARSHTGP